MEYDTVNTNNNTLRIFPTIVLIYGYFMLQHVAAYWWGF